MINDEKTFSIDKNILTEKTDELIVWYIHFVVICCFLAAQRNSSKKNTRDLTEQPRVKAIFCSTGYLLIS